MKLNGQKLQAHNLYLSIQMIFPSTYKSWCHNKASVVYWVTLCPPPPPTPTSETPPVRTVHGSSIYFYFRRVPFKGTIEHDGSFNRSRTGFYCLPTSYRHNAAVTAVGNLFLCYVNYSRTRQSGRVIYINLFSLKCHNTTQLAIYPKRSKRYFAF